MSPFWNLDTKFGTFYGVDLDVQIIGNNLVQVTKILLSEQYFWPLRLINKTIALFSFSSPVLIFQCIDQFWLLSIFGSSVGV